MRRDKAVKIKWMNDIQTIIGVLIIFVAFQVPSFGHSVIPTAPIQKDVKPDGQLNRKEPMVEAKTIIKTEHSITKEELTTLMSKFIKKLVQETDEDYRVIQFANKEELLDDFEEIMSREIAKVYVDFYFTEKNGNLYIVPTETPPWFHEKNEYDMIQINDNQIKMIQENDSVFYGQYVIELILTYSDQWKITDVRIQ